MDIIETVFEGLYEVRAPELVDPRGGFRKLFHAADVTSVIADFSVAEVYCSTSAYGAIRGLHFQIPPFAHHKLIFCLSGRAIDVCVDLRKSSATYGRSFSLEISGADGRGLFVPKGFAHGLQALEGGTTMVSMASEVYAPEYERGIAWDSCGIDWPCKTPILSDKDRRQTPLSRFESPFP